MYILTKDVECAGIIVPGERVYMIKAKPGGKTSHAIHLARERRENGLTAVVGSYPSLAELFVQVALDNGCFSELGRFTHYQKQVTFGNSRVDFVLHRADDIPPLLLEVKSVVCADFPSGGVPEDRSPIGVYEAHEKLSEEYKRTAIFPHGKQKPKIKVVSDRAIKHLHELIEYQQLKGSSDHYAACVIFMVNRSDCHAFRPCHEADMLFAQILKKAVESGVLVLAYDVVWEDGRAYFGKKLPVKFSPDVLVEDIDEQHLKDVLHFNLNNPRR